jgi:hypothetical protein
MAAPTAPTLATIVSEALKKAGHASPAAALTTRAQDYWMEEVKNDVFTLAKKLRSLQTQSVAILTKGKYRYAFPSDFSSHISLTLLDGNNTGTAQTGAAGSITLAAASNFAQDWMIGKEILITGGTGAGSMSQCTAYDTSTKVATVSPNFATAPDNTSTYLIVESYSPLKEGPIWNLDENIYTTGKGTPNEFRIVGSASYGEFIITPPPDQTYYGLKLIYYADLMGIDLAGTLMATIYKRWRNVFIQGVKARCLENDDDERTDNEMKKYNGMLNLLVMREQYGMDLSNLNATIED